MKNNRVLCACDDVPLGSVFTRITIFNLNSRHYLLFYANSMMLLLTPGARSHVQQRKSRGGNRNPCIHLCVFTFNKCQAAESNSCPSSLSSRASPELCCVGSDPVETTCRI